MIAELLSESVPAGARVLDVGSGHGDNAVSLARHGYRVVAVELDGSLVREFRHRALEHGVALLQADAEHLPLADNSHDAAVLVEVFEHVRHPEVMLRELGRVLRPGGVLLLALPTGYTEAVYWWIHPGYAKNAGHVRRYRRSDVESMVRSCGFRVVGVETRNFIPALSWLGHAVLRSRSDHTGTIHQHHWMDAVLRVVVAVWRRMPVLRVLYRYLDRHVGKSWYFSCAKTR